MTDSNSTPSAPRPLPTIMRDVADDVQELVRLEVELVKLEIADMVGRAAKAAALFAVALVLMLYLAGFALGTIARALEGPLPDWAAWLIVTGTIALLVGMLVMIGVKLLPREGPGGRAKEELSSTLDTLRSRVDEAKRTFSDEAEGHDDGE